MKKCPFCAEEIQNEAIKCRYCGSIVEKSSDGARDKDENVIVQQYQSPRQQTFNAYGSQPKDVVTNVKQGALIGGVVCLSLGIALMYLSLMLFIIYVPLFLAAFILSIVAMAQHRVTGGVLLLIGTIIIPPICLYYFNSQGDFLGQTDKAKVVTTKANLKMLHNAVAQFKMDTGRYPTEREGLNVLIESPTDVTGYQSGGYIDSTELPKDAWGYDFIYIAYPESGKPYAIVSFGTDGAAGGEGYDADLYSTDTDIY